MMFRAQRLLLAVVQLTTAREVAARCGVSETSVYRWRIGEQTPSDVPRLRLWLIYRIPLNAWGKPAVPLARVKHTQVNSRV